MSYSSAKSRETKTFDASLEMKDAGLVAASAAAQVDSSNKILDAGVGRFKGELVIDVTAIEVASGDEGYSIEVQGSNSSSFASGNVALAELQLGDTSVTNESADSSTGRYILPFTNVGVDGTRYRYIRVYTRVVGTIATGINYSAFIAKP